MVTIISGNLEAWIGLSAVHAYLFLEQLYDALVEAQLIRPLLLAPPPPPAGPSHGGARQRRSLLVPALLSKAFVNFGRLLISILTRFRAKLASATLWRRSNS